MAILELRDYQQRTVAEVRRREFAGPIRIAVQAPTGAGKTAMMVDLLRDPMRQMVLTHRRILLDQLSSVLTKWGIPHGFRAAGREENLMAPIQLAMLQTESLRTFKNKRTPMHRDCDRVQVDEIHVQKGETALRVLGEYNRAGASTIGYTATPVDLKDVIDDVIVAATIPELVKSGHLCPPKVFGCSQLDRKKLEKLKHDKNGEYLASQVNALVKPPLIFGSVMENYKRLNPDGRPFILFAHSVKASRWWAQKFTHKGYPVAHISCEDIWVDGKSWKNTPELRQECFDRINSGDLKGLSNRFVLREGVDLPIVGHAILTCPVGARHSLVQMCGRVLRPYPGREYAIIQDHAGSIIDHPPLMSEVPWDWELAPGLAEKIYKAQMREDKIPEAIICPKCKFARYSDDTCPQCGYAYHKYARFVFQANGELRMIHGKNHRHRPTTRTTDSERDWLGMYHGNRRNYSRRTFEQIYTNYARVNGWVWLPRNLKYMPKDAATWFMAVGDVPPSELRQRSYEDE
jgi:superfamily II DNA or RNA helicase